MLLTQQQRADADVILEELADGVVDLEELVFELVKLRATLPEVEHPQ